MKINLYVRESKMIFLSLLSSTPRPYLSLSLPPLPLLLFFFLLLLFLPISALELTSSTRKLAS